jgi:hypothetical protein
MTTDGMKHLRHLDIDLRPLPKFHETGLKRRASAAVARGLKLRQVIDYHPETRNLIRESYNRGK